MALRPGGGHAEHPTVVPWADGGDHAVGDLSWVPPREREERGERRERRERTEKTVRERKQRIQREERRERRVSVYEGAPGFGLAPHELSLRRRGSG